MSNQVFAHDGNGVIEGTWTAITASKGFDSTLLSLPKDATHFVRYTTGGTAALIPGETLTGGSSTSTCILVAQAVEVGTAGSSDVGIIFIKSPSAAFEAETLTGTGTGTVAIIQDFIELHKYGQHPKAALIAAETYPLNITISGTTPTVAAGTNHGITLAAGNTWMIRGVQNVRNFRAINTVASSGAIMKYVLFFG
jgi:hypothetical protein